MKENKTGRVIKAVGGRFKVVIKDETFNCQSRGILKRYSEIIVGDIVDISRSGNGYVIEKAYDRSNNLIRPQVSNIDNALIVIAPLPRPDFLLVDKLIINCHKENIEPILCYNKIDINDEELVDNIKAMYDNIIKTIYVSALNYEGIDKLKDCLRGKLTCFAGQSAVGKSSIINALVRKNIQEIGDLSRIERGRNTTRHIEIFNLGEDMLIADTCGFSSLENLEIPPEELSLYYDDYMEYTDKCKFKCCSHINEPDCAVKEAVGKGILNLERYNRYKLIYEDIKQNWSKRYE